VIRQQYSPPYSEYKHLQFDFQIIIQAAQKNLRPTIPETTPAPLKALIERCFDPQAENRPSAEEVVESLRSIKQHYEQNKEEWNKAITGTINPPAPNPNGSNPLEQAFVK
jgi:hypothetical protein